MLDILIKTVYRKQKETPTKVTNIKQLPDVHGVVRKLGQWMYSPPQ